MTVATIDDKTGKKSRVTRVSRFGFLRAFIHEKQERKRMKGDFSSYRYRPGINYLSVLKQQGRVYLDSDWNEHAEIVDERIRRLMRDMLGDIGIPLISNEITDDNSSALRIDNFSVGPGNAIDFSIGKGVAYVGGNPLILENDITFRTQTDYPEPTVAGEGDILMTYIEVWNKTVNYIDDESIREPALGGPDTSLRKKLVGQVKARYVSRIATPARAYDFFMDINRMSSALFTLKIDQSAHQIPISFGEVDLGGGLIPGNLHLRVEFHRGPAANGKTIDGFKWSDENASAVVRILKAIENDSFIVEETEPVIGESLKEGDLVEVSNAATELHRQGGQLAKIVSIDQGEKDVLVTLDSEIHPSLRRFEIGGKTGFKMKLAPRLRRWSGFIAPFAPKSIYDLGRGIKVTFNGGKDDFFRPGDYWTFAIRDRDHNRKYAPQKAAPDGVRIFGHPLALILPPRGRRKPEIIDCRRFFKPMCAFHS